MPLAPRDPTRPAHRGTICLEDARVLSHDHLAGEQHVLRVAAPRTAARARPGMFAHLQCDPALPMRRPLSIMRADGEEGWVDFLYKVVGLGSRRLAARRVGETLSVLGPIGRPFGRVDPAARPVLIGGGVGIPPMIFLAEELHRHHNRARPVVFMGSEVPFPFPLRPSGLLLEGAPEGVIACMPLLDDWGIPSRLASGQGYAGCFDGLVTDLARGWLGSLAEDARRAVRIYSCGPTPMLAAVAALAGELELPCEVCLEEYMACGVGGCAGCAVRVWGGQGPSMQRVCVDGPVFDAAAVFPAASRRRERHETGA